MIVLHVSFCSTKVFFFFNLFFSELHRASQVVLVVKNPLDNAGGVRDGGSVPGLGRSPGGGHANPLQYSCHGQSLVATVHRFTKSRTRLSDLAH